LTYYIGIQKEVTQQIALESEVERLRTELAAFRAAASL